MDATSLTMLSGTGRRQKGIRRFVNQAPRPEIDLISVGIAKGRVKKGGKDGRITPGPVRSNILVGSVAGP